MYIYDSFTDIPGKGNRTALVKSRGLSDDRMQEIARDLGFAETLFYEGLDLRFFSPEEEIDFCGHASLAFIWHRGLEKKREAEVLTTPVGEIPVFYSYKEGQLDRVWMLQAQLQTRQIAFDREALLASLGLSASDIDKTYPLMAAYTGNWDLFVPIISESIIDKLSPDMEALASINRVMGVLSTHLYTGQTRGEYDFYTRDFAPACGIPEDPVTGSANGALFGLLIKEGILSDNYQASFAQGHALGIQGRVYAKLDRASGRILVGGRAVRIE